MMEQLSALRKKHGKEFVFCLPMVVKTILVIGLTVQNLIVSAYADQYSKSLPALWSLNVSFSSTQAKGSHNSYQRNETITQQLAWAPDEPWQGGCRSIEYDIVQSYNDWKWSVQHGGSYSIDPQKQLPFWLRKLRNWANQNPNHDVVILFLDLKNKPMSDTDFCTRIDVVLANPNNLGADRLFKPRDLMKAPNKDLVANAQQFGWPTLGELRGKIIVCFTGNSERGKFYANYHLRERLAFSDRDCGTGIKSWPSMTKGNRVILNLHVFSNPGSGDWRGLARTFAAQRGFITRGWVVNGETLWNDALNQGLINIIATDKIRGHSWATVGSHPFRKIPHGVWSGQTKITSKNGAKTSASPGLAVYNNRLYMVYRGEGSSNIWCCYFNGSNWSGQAKITSKNRAKTSASPALIVYDNRLYLVYRGEGSSNIWSCYFNGSKWSGQAKITSGNGAKTSASPALAVYNNRLYMVYRGAGSSNIWSCYFDGSRWSKQTKITSKNKAKTSTSPALAVYNNRLYMVYRGEGSSNIWCCYFNGSKWSGQTKITSKNGAKTSASPGLAVYNNRLYMVYRGEGSSNIWSCYFNGSNWSGQTKITSGNGAKTSASPGLVMYNHRLYMVYRGERSANIWTCHFPL